MADFYGVLDDFILEDFLASADDDDDDSDYDIFVKEFDASGD